MEKKKLYYGNKLYGAGFERCLSVGEPHRLYSLPFPASSVSSQLFPLIPLVNSPSSLSFSGKEIKERNVLTLVV